MKKAIIASTVIALSLFATPVLAAGEQPQKSPVKVSVDPRVELMSVIFYLAGNMEYTQGRVKSYSKDVESHFGKFRDHAVVKLAVKLRQTTGVSFDAPMSLAVLLNNTQQLETIVPLNPWPESLDKRWTVQSVQEFLKDARQFVKDASFNEFIEQHKPLYEIAVSRMKKTLEDNAHLEWFEDFFGERPDASFNIALGMLNGGSCYGPHCRTSDGKEQLYCVLGVWKTDDNDLPVFTNEVMDTVIHEFCHSYANGVIDRHAKELAKAGEQLYNPVSKAMNAQAYASGMTVLRESLVRACVIRYVNKYNGEKAAKKAAKMEKGRKFACVPKLSELLAEYESNRDKYPTLDSFSPKLIAFFNEFAANFAREQKALDAKRPKIVSVIPVDGDENVNPDLKEIKIVFDRPMKDKCWSLVGGGPHFPETVGKCAYDAKCTTWTVPVKLKPNWEYYFMINAEPRFMAFQSKDGVPLAPVVVKFKTAAASGESAETSKEDVTEE